MGATEIGEIDLYKELDKNNKSSSKLLPGTMSSTKNFGGRSKSVTKSNFGLSSEQYTQDLGLNKYIADILDKHMLANHTIEEENKQ